jgi:hypothetical protein
MDKKYEKCIVNNDDFRRSLQRRAAVHLESLFTLLDKSRRLETTLNAETKDILVRNSLFVRWMLANRFGVSYKL